MSSHFFSIKRKVRLKRQLFRSILSGLLLLSTVLLLAGCSPSGDAVTAGSNRSAVQESSSTVKSEGKLRVSYLDVGQGDSILIQIPNGKNVLIDAGENDQGDKVVNYLKKQGVKQLDAVIWTHPHSDHIGGADVVTRAFPIRQVIMPKVTATTQTYRSLTRAIQEKDLKITEAKAGLKLDLGPEVTAQLLAPNSTYYEDVNNYSAVLKLTYGQNTFLFTGDAQTESEQEMIGKGYNLKADVLKVGHHGSHTSTSPAFLAKVQPKVAVISVGKGNDYGHPHAETLKKLQDLKLTVLRTDQAGTIVIEADGQKIDGVQPSADKN